MKTPAFQFYPKDWLSSPKVCLMSLDQEGAYIRLLAYAWMDDDCAVPSDPDKLCRMLRITRQEWDKGSYDLVISTFQQHPNKPHLLVNERLLQEREKQDNWRSKCSSGGKKSAAKRWGAQPKVVDKGSGKGRGNYSVTLQFAVCSLHILTPESVTPEDIYNAYPLKVGKPKALRAIAKAKLCPVCLLEKVKQFAKSTEGRERRFIAHPSTWFNEERYNDDPSTWVNNGSTQQPQQPTWARLKALKERQAALKAETAEMWQAREHPELVEELKQVQAKIAELEKAALN